MYTFVYLYEHHCIMIIPIACKLHAFNHLHFLQYDYCTKEYSTLPESQSSGVRGKHLSARKMVQGTNFPWNLSYDQVMTKSTDGCSSIVHLLHCYCLMTVK